MIAETSRCRGVREPHDANPVAWIECCQHCGRRADAVEGGAYFYASPPVTMYHGTWQCGARVPESTVSSPLASLAGLPAAYQPPR